jgi:spore coat polysaccharide biosynthesis predicted glycosyltransferase SpsG
LKLLLNEVNKVVFIAIAGQKYGQGHLQRALRMVEALVQLQDVTLVCNQDCSEQLAIENKLVVHKLNLAQPAAFIEELQLGAGDILWFDLPDECYYILSHFVGYKLKIISVNMFERKDMVRYEAVSIYPSFEKTKKIVQKQPKLVSLSGYDYILVPDEFFATDSIKGLGSFVVTMGGADPMGFTKHILTALVKIKRTDLSFKVILPKTMRANEVINSYSLPKFVEIFDFGELDFSEALKNASYTVMNGGLTRYECIAAKTYFIALSIHKAQFDITAMSSKFGYGKNFCIFGADKVDDLVHYLDNLVITDDRSILDSIPIKLKKRSAHRIFRRAIGVL